ncbi:MAG: cytidine deaminase [Rikenellaceae bacterium]|nr:cytidine deaminase [Rikenellaceae bacterium]
MEKFILNYRRYASAAELAAADSELVARAKEACGSAYAPYSGFRVGAAARLRSGQILTGSNQESEVFPSGICAERSLLFHWQAHHADDPIETLAVASVPGERECYPCGGCRQVIVDTEKRQGAPMRVLMCSSTSVAEIAPARLLLPFTFEL